MLKLKLHCLREMIHNLLNVSQKQSDQYILGAHVQLLKMKWL